MTAHPAFSRSRGEGILLGPGTLERKKPVKKIKRKASPYFSCLENKNIPFQAPAGR